MQKKTKNMKVFLHSFKRIFRSRSIIIISDHKVDHVPLSGVMQGLLFVGCFGFFSSVSYITGSYMAARSVIVEKDKKIVTASLEKGRISDEINVLKRDLVRLNQNGNELNAFSKMIINGHSEELPSQNPGMEISSNSLADGSIFGQNTGKLLDRISFLENRVNEIATDNDHLITAIRTRTTKKIDYLEDIIASTGLDADRLERIASSDTKSFHKGTTHRVEAMAISPVADESAKTLAASSDQGGPFIRF